MNFRIVGILIAIELVLLIALGGLGAYLYREYGATGERAGALAARVDETNAALERLRTDMNARMDEDAAKTLSLSDALYADQKRIDELEQDMRGFDRTVGKLSGSVKTLQKLTTTDPELLQKYSKVYFLNENYVPSDLTVIDETYDLVNGKEVSVQSDTWPFLKRLLENAFDDGVDIMVLSGYRSFKDQTILKDQYVMQYGTGANRFSADQGYSEHQLGTAVDFTTKALGENLAGFEGTPAHQWLLENAYKYGFVMSYPKNNSYYIYEPWHWRFVGIDLANELHSAGKNFYDLEQREIDGYLATLFDD